jgi:peptidoglycan/LPS O-acetylase OafA/YrhL
MRPRRHDDRIIRNMQKLRRQYGLLIERLARVTTSGRRIRELDGLRFIAIFTVLIQHVYQVVLARYSPGRAPAHDLFASLVRDSRIGVELFFVISGFILGMPVAKQHIFGGQKVSLKQYYWRRITRLEPPYLLSMFIWFCVLVFYWHQSARELFPHLLASVFYVHNLVYKGFSTINSVAWSLEIEVQFYVLAPLLALAFLMRPAWLRRTVLVVGSVLLIESFKLLNRWLPAVAHAGGVGGTLLNYLPLFLMGFLLADIYLTDWNERPTISGWCDWIAIPGWLLLPFYFRQQQMLHHVILHPVSFPFILFVLCWVSFRGKWIRRFLASSFIMTTGGMCYSIYLLHLPLIKILAQYSPVPLIPSVPWIGINAVMYLLIWGIPVAAVSIAYFLLIEKPCMRKDWPQRLLARLRGEALPGPAPVERPTTAETILDVPPETTSPLSENQPVP